MNPQGIPWLFGEVLFDHFPDGRRVLGGAPFNVAWHLRAFGLAPRLVSRLGDDEQGDRVRRAMRDWSMDTDGMQRDARLCTGLVQVTIAHDEPSYEIVHPVAWDRIEAPESPSERAGLLYHGSLALRDPVSQETLLRLRRQLGATVFLDVNLRPPWFRIAQVLAWMRDAHWAKLNKDEFKQLFAAAGLAGSNEPLPAQALRFREALGLEGLIVTLGAAGALLSTGEQPVLEAAAAAPADPLVDTVGAGDAFSSVLILGLLRDWPPELGLTRALEFAAAICGQRGATVTDREFYDRLRRSWGMEDV